MSADNWAECPKCYAAGVRDRHAKQQAADRAYGVESPAAYLKLLEAAKEPVAPAYSLREDYIIGTKPDGEFYVSYSARCQKCDFRHQHTFVKRVVEIEKRTCCECADDYFPDLQDETDDAAFCPKCVGVAYGC